jgi:hypothetical protein
VKCFVPSALQCPTSYEFLLLTVNVIIPFPDSERKLSSLLHTAVCFNNTSLCRNWKLGADCWHFFDSQQPLMGGWVGGWLDSQGLLIENTC